MLTKLMCNCTSKRFFSLEVFQVSYWFRWQDFCGGFQNKFQIDFADWQDFCGGFQNKFQIDFADKIFVEVFRTNFKLNWFRWRDFRGGFQNKFQIDFADKIFVEVFRNNFKLISCLRRAGKRKQIFCLKELQKNYRAKSSIIERPLRSYTFLFPYWRF